MYVARPATSYRLLGLGEGPGSVGIVAASFALIPLFLAIPLGRLTDRHRNFPSLVLGCALQAAACGALSFAESAFSVACASALLGLGHLGVALAVQDLIARESEARHHDQHFGLLTAGVSVGQMIGPLLAGVVVVADDLRGSTTEAMLAGAAISTLAVAFAATSHSRRAANARDSAHAGAKLRAILGTRGVPAGIFASIAVLSAADIFTAYMPVLGEKLGIAPTAVGVLLALRAGASIASRVGIGAITERVGRTRLLWASTGLGALAFAALTVTQNVVALALLSAMAGFALGFGQPLSMTIVVQLVPERARATALGLRLTGNRIGQVAAPAAAGLVAGSVGVMSVFWLTSTMLASGAFVLHRNQEAFRDAARELIEREAAAAVEPAA